jgi:hypothetical protein
MIDHTIGRSEMGSAATEQDNYSIDTDERREGSVSR